MRIGLYAATLDPITKGHRWIIDEAAGMFDKLVVAVADNHEKRGKVMFSAEERVAMVKDTLPLGLELGNDVEVVTYAGGHTPPFTARFAKAIGATHLIRGIRNEADFTAEQAIRHVNQDICPEVRTVFLVPPRHLSEVSSSMVKGLVGFDGWRDVVERYVDSPVVKRFQARRLEASEVLMRLGASYSCAFAAKQFLDKAYGDMSESSRVYHNDRHIRECLGLMDMVVSDSHVSPQDFDEIAAALWFHDCVYDVGSKNNETRSAGEFGRFASEINTDVVATVKRMIEGTREHAFSGEHKANVVSDIDMAILAAPAARFGEYEDAIRREYGHIPDPMFYPARRRFLESCLAGPVYYAEKFRPLRARMAENVRRLLATEPYAKRWDLQGNEG